MQEFTNPTAMNSPYSAMPGSYGSPDAANAPKLGTPIPGTTGGLPQKPGLSVTSTPLAPVLSGQGYAGGGLAHAAEATRRMGRGEDSMLIHMTPNEVNSLQGLAMAMGGSLTINPHTGLPEAGWLGKLLPTILGIAGSFVGIPPWLTAAAVGAGQTAITGDLRKGLMAGLGAYGGASLGTAMGAGNTATTLAPNVAQTATGAIPSTLSTPLSQTALGQAANMVPTSSTIASQLAGNAAGTIATPALNLGSFAGQTAGQAVASGLANAGASAAGAGAPAAGGFLNKFSAAARTGVPSGMLSKYAPTAAGLGLISGVSSAFAPGVKMPDGRVDNSYQGPYTYQKREATFAPSTEELLKSSAERDYFKVDQPEVYNVQGQLVQPGSSTAPGANILQPILNPNAKKGEPMYSFREVPYMQDPEEARRQQLAQLGLRLPGMASGGTVNLRDGSFVVDARTVSELGNGSSGAGQELLARLGGRPVRGPGDGVSDSVPARIGRDQPARVARDEVIFDPEAVRGIGKGDQKRGAQKLYAMMEKAHKARKRAGRGSDTKLRKGLA